MRIDRPDPAYTASPRSQRNFSLAIRVSAVFVALLWLILLLDRALELELARYGLLPRHAVGLLGVLTTPLLHGGVMHLASNSMPLLVAGTAMLFLYPNSALRVLPLLYAGAPLLVWLLGRGTYHIGASGLVYGMLTYVFLGGVLRRDLRSVAMALLVWFLYGSLVSGLVPGRAGVSWELHLAGTVLGASLAVVYRHWDRPPRKRYDWEDEDEPPEPPGP